MNVSATNAELIDVFILDLTGRQIAKFTDKTIDLTTIQSGTYIVRIKTDKGESAKVIVKK